MPTASLREQILARISAALSAAAPGGATVYRSREVSITRNITPAVVIMPRNGTSTRLAAQVDRHELEVDVEIFVRGDPWDQLADPVDVAAHAVLVSDAQLADLSAQIRRIGEDFSSQEADRTAGTLTARYLVTWNSHAADLTRRP